MKRHTVWPVGAQVMIDPTSEYLDQATDESDGKTQYLLGIITHYEESDTEEGQFVDFWTEDHIYWVEWHQSTSNCYRPRDLILQHHINSSFTFLLKNDILTM
jgi:hypothetical protein